MYQKQEINKKETLKEIEQNILHTQKNVEFEIVRNIMREIIYKRKINPFNYDYEQFDEDEKFYEKTKKYKNQLYWFLRKYKIKRQDFFNYIDCFKTYTYAIIYNKIINDEIMKKKNGQPMSERNPLYFDNFEILLNKYKYIELEDIIEFNFPNYRNNIFKDINLRDSLGNYILPRLVEEFDINIQYNLSNLFLKKT